MNRFPVYIQFCLVMSLILLISGIGTFYDARVDLTQDERFTLSSDIKNLMRESNKPILLTVLFEGNLPPSFKNYRSYLSYYLSELDRYDEDIQVIYQDISQTSPEELASIKRLLEERGLSPISRTSATAEELNKSLIYPFIGVSTEQQISFIDVLDAKRPDQSEEDAINDSMNTFPDKLFKALSKSLIDKPKTIVVIGASNRLISEALNREQVALQGYRFAPINGETWLSLPDSVAIDGYIVVLTGESLLRADYLALDQAMMKSMPGMMLIDKVPVSLETVSEQGGYLAQPSEYMIEDQLFRMGMRINSNVLSSIQCSRIPQVTGDRGGQSDVSLLAFPYHLILTPQQSSLALTDLMRLAFASDIDTLKLPDGMYREVLLKSSDLTKVNETPFSLQLNNLRIELKAGDFTDGQKILGIQIQGPSQSLFANRLSQQDQSLLLSNGFKDKTDQVNLAVIANSDLITPMKDTKGAFYPIGFNTLDNQMYRGNVEFVAGLLDKLMGYQIPKSTVSTKLYSPINKAKLAKNKWKYGILIVGSWLIGFILVSLMRYARRRKYSNYLGS